MWVVYWLILWETDVHTIQRIVIFRIRRDAMAAICFGPPPLPPNKKSTLLSNGMRCRKPAQSLLSSTYRSFRDPAEDNDIEVMTFKETSFSEGKCAPNATKEKRLSNTNSLNRNKDGKLLLARSHSEGNLSKKTANAPMTINKYIKVLSGSWKNLLNCKWLEKCSV